MTRLFGLLYTIVGSSLAGAAVIATLVLGKVDARSILLAAVVGALLALPLAWTIAKKISDE